MICGASILAWVTVGLVLGTPLGALMALVWVAIRTDRMHD